MNPYNATTIQAMQTVDMAARALAVALLPRDMRRAIDLNGAFASIGKGSADAISATEDIVLLQSHQRIVESAIRMRLPSIGSGEHADAGGLLGYSANYPALYRCAAKFVDKVLKSAKPADLPVERPTTFEFVVNKKTARALGMALPSAILRRAGRQVERESPACHEIPIVSGDFRHGGPPAAPGFRTLHRCMRRVPESAVLPARSLVFLDPS